MATTTNILYLPFRKTLNVDLSSAIKQYISTKYDQHPDMFKADLEVIDKLRKDAVFVREPHTSGLKKIAAYAAQLVWMGGKFPIDIGAEFTWYPALGYNTERPISQDNLKYELSNILFNLAALYTQLAASVNRSSPEGLKSAAANFCHAAGVLKHIKDVVVPELRAEPVEDMDIATLQSLEELFLAQAQECFWQKAVMDGYKDASIAKLAARVSDLYSVAGDWAVQSESISSEWIHHMSAKHHHFAAAAQYRQACDCLEKRRYGEEVARLRDSMQCVNEALKESRYVNKIVQHDLNSLKNKVSEDLKRAEKDNDLIYLNTVPPKSELKSLERANMVIARVPKEVSEPHEFLGDHKEFGQPLFAHLVPYAVHMAASIYEERRDRLVNTQIIEELEKLNTKIHDTLRSLGLPGSLQALERPLGIPPTLLSHAEEIRQVDALNRLQRSFSDTAKLKAGDDAAFEEGRECLHAEEREDNALRMKYGTRAWTRPDSRTAAPELWAQLGEIDGYLKSSAVSDERVRSMYREVEPLLRILASSDREIAEYVPSSRRVAIPPKLEEEAGKLRSCLNDLTRLESRRRRKIESFRDKAKRDDISSAILVETARLERAYPNTQIAPAHFEDFFEKRLEQYDADILSIRTDEREQDELLRELQLQNTKFIKARQGDTSSKEREKALQTLEEAYFKYKELVNSLEVGRKFYNDLNKIVGRFRDKAREFAYTRRAEASTMESDLNIPQLASLNINQNVPPQTPVPAPQPRNLRSSARVAPESPMPAPIPTRSPAQQPQMPSVPAATPGTWNPQMGIRFGGASPGQGQQKNENVAPGQAAGPMPGQWDPNQGIRFG